MMFMCFSENNILFFLVGEAIHLHNLTDGSQALLFHPSFFSKNVTFSVNRLFWFKGAVSSRFAFGSLLNRDIGSFRNFNVDIFFGTKQLNGCQCLFL